MELEEEMKVCLLAPFSGAMMILTGESSPLNNIEKAILSNLFQK